MPPKPKRTYFFERGCDYCGPEGSLIAKIVPDTIYGVDVSYCCFLHDQAYRKGGTKADRLEADRDFRDLLRARAAARLPLLLQPLALIRCQIYYLAVRALGWRCFTYKEQPDEIHDPTLDLG